MLNVGTEFRKGIFFIRLIGNLDNNYLKKENNIKELIEYNRFKYIVINTNYPKCNKYYDCNNNNKYCHNSLKCF